MPFSKDNEFEVALTAANKVSTPPYILLLRSSFGRQEVELWAKQPCTAAFIQSTKCQPYGKAVLGIQESRSDWDTVVTVEGHIVYQKTK